MLLRAEGNCRDGRWFITMSDPFHISQTWTHEKNSEKKTFSGVWISHVTNGPGDFRADCLKAGNFIHCWLKETGAASHLVSYLKRSDHCVCNTPKWSTAQKNCQGSSVKGGRDGKRDVLSWRQFMTGLTCIHPVWHQQHIAGQWVPRPVNSPKKKRFHNRALVIGGWHSEASLAIVPEHYTN